MQGIFKVTTKMNLLLVRSLQASENIKSHVIIIYNTRQSWADGKLSTLQKIDN